MIARTEVFNHFLENSQLSTTTAIQRIGKLTYLENICKTKTNLNELGQFTKIHFYAFEIMLKITNLQLNFINFRAEYIYH